MSAGCAEELGADYYLMQPPVNDSIFINVNGFGTEINKIVSIIRYR